MASIRVAHDLDMAEMRGRDQRGAVIGTGDICARWRRLECDLEHFQIVLHRRDGDDVVVLRVHRIRIGAEPQQRSCGRVLAAEGSDVQRRAAVGILQVRLLAGSDQLLDLGHIAIGGGGMQPGVDLEFALGRRSLRPQRAGH